MGNTANHLAWKEEGKHGLAWYVSLMHMLSSEQNLLKLHFHSHMDLKDVTTFAFKQHLGSNNCILGIYSGTSHNRPDNLSITDTGCASYNRQTENHTYLSCRNLILEKYVESAEVN